VLTKTQAEKILEPYLQLFWECVTKAWEEYVTKYAHVRQTHSARSRASVIHDHMIEFAKKFFEGIEGVYISQKRGLTTIIIRDQLQARLKKLDRNKRSRNINTQQSFLFKAQLDLPGIESTLTHLDIGYMLNHLQTAIEAVYVTCPTGKNLAWWMELNGSTKGQGTVVPIAPAPSAPHVAAAAKRRVTPKKVSDGKKKDEDKS
jgi:hypothetical protein